MLSKNFIVPNNAGYWKFMNECQFIHPEVNCSETNCSYKTCNKIHPKPCKKFAIRSCKFDDLCEFVHDKIFQEETENYHENNSDDINNDENYVDYDNIRDICTPHWQAI